jgi:type IV pilus assembly protein PilB
MEKSGKKLGEILIEKGIITEAQMHDALRDQKINPQFIGLILKQKGLVTDNDIMAALAEQFGLEIVDLKGEYIDMEMARRFSTALVIDHKCFPLKVEDDLVKFAIVNPLNAVALSKIEEESGNKPVELVLVLESDMDEVLKQYRKYVGESITRLLKRKPTDGSIG